MELTDKTISLRPIERDDTDLIVSWRNNPEVRRNFIFQAPFTREMHLHWLDTRVATGEVVQFIIEEGPGNFPVGSVFIRDIDHGNHKGEFGIFIGEDAARGRGLGTQAVRLILGHGFAQLGLNRIFLRALAENTGAIKSYERAGFVREGCLRQDVLLNGTYHDVVLMSVLRGECES